VLGHRLCCPNLGDEVAQFSGIEARRSHHSAAKRLVQRAFVIGFAMRKALFDIFENIFN
jgi:hypothetical protein